MPAYTTDSGDTGGRRQWIIALALLAAATSMAFLPDARQQQVASALRGSVLRPFVMVQSGLSTVRTGATDAGALRRQLDSLTALTAGHLALAAENRRLLAMNEVRGRTGPGWIPATVVRPGTAGSESMFLLNVGSEDGVERYDPVIAGQGVVGVVLEVHARTSMAMDWTHPDFTVSAMDPRGIVYGLVRARRGDFREADRLEFDGTAFQAQLEDGTPIVTSNASGVWPRGVPIGKVDGVAEADAGWRKSYWLRPMVEPASVTHALVGVDSAEDLFGVWPPDSVRTDAELALESAAREDSLRALADSVRMLRALLAAPRPLRDSLFASLLVQGSDSLSALWLRAGMVGDSAEAGGAGGRSGRSAGAGQGSGGAPAATPAPPPVQPREIPQVEPRRPSPAGGALPGSPVPSFPRPTDTIQVGPPAGGGAPPDTLGVATAAAVRSAGTAVERQGETHRTREGGAARR